MLRLILIISTAVQQPQALRRVVALLDYVATDYARAVGPHGEVLSQTEHQEQIGFVQDAARELREDAGAPAEDLAVKLDALARQVSAKAPPADVASQARAVREQIVQRFHVVLFPVRAP